MREILERWVENPPKISRDEVKSILGEPDDWGSTSRKYKTPSIYVYKHFELWFLPWKNGHLTKVINRITNPCCGRICEGEEDDCDNCD